MAFRIEEKLVIGVASSALFKLDEADEIFRTCGLAAYRAYRRFRQAFLVPVRGWLWLDGGERKAVAQRPAVLD